jgi:hypothetical protein
LKYFDAYDGTVFITFGFRLNLVAQFKTDKLTFDIPCTGFGKSIKKIIFLDP